MESDAGQLHQIRNYVEGVEGVEGDIGSIEFNSNSANLGNSNRHDFELMQHEECIL